MKIRTDFVSNSSSSSFILGKNKLLGYYKVTPEDIRTALTELYGKAECEKFQNERWNNSHDMPFTVYELPQNLKKTLKDLGYTLSDFSAGSRLGEWAEKEYSTFLTVLSNVSDFYLCSGSDEELNGNRNGKIPKAIRDLVTRVRRYYEISSMKDMALSKDAVVLVHFHENEIWNLKGVGEYGPADLDSWAAKYMTPAEKKAAKKRKWTTCHSTNRRVYEILLNKLVEMGKIKLDDPFVLGQLYPADDQAKKDFPDCKSWFPNDIYTADEFIDESELGFVGHEG